MRLLSLCLAIPCVLFAQEDALKDQPHFTRLSGFFIEQGEDRDFDAVKFWDGKQLRSVEGRRWMRKYRLKDGQPPSSSLQVLRNYQNALKSAQGTVFFSGTAANPRFEDLDGRPLLSGRLQKGGKEIWLQVVCFENAYTLHCVETEAMVQEVSAAAMADALAKDGFIALDIHFDTGKATLKADSQALVDQIAELLKGNPALKVGIEGHTDNTGTPAGNKKLSEDRAKAVVAAVAAKGVQASRMSAVGWGQEKPVADNRSEEGRAKNRRVEVVKKT